MKYRKKPAEYKAWQVGNDERPSWIANSITRQIDDHTFHHGKLSLVFVSDGKKNKIYKKYGFIPHCAVIIGDTRYWAEEGDYILKDELHEFSFWKKGNFEKCFEEIKE